MKTLETIKPIDTETGKSWGSPTLSGFEVKTSFITPAARLFVAQMRVIALP
ncbi:hypothetical protein [Fibrella aestuarina]|uniref:hypothetical protein n=1 Tax=Fibrella aestuarina TaxID=651143 RepID=UPI00130E139E|nr:hypothetical protein [Fibrella aestuarina]